MDRRLRSDAGEAVLEFALLAPILLLILASILETGRVFDAWVVVHNAAREGARAGVVAAPAVDVAATAQQAAERYLAVGLGARGDVAATLVEPPVVTAEAVAVTARADVAPYTPLGRAVVSDTVPVRASATMRRQ
ncbi:MAG: pilus assembly protein [Chloroflexi bacterium]|nr:pilus assembly protein [Chloroflexota bacterium]